MILFSQLRNNVAFFRKKLLNWLWLAIKTKVPVGYEDETGFHLV